MRRLFALVALLIPFAFANESSRYYRIYQISSRPFLYDMSLKYGRPMKIGDVPASEWVDIAQKGYTALYLLGVWSLGKVGLEIDRRVSYTDVLPDCKIEDVIGSPFAVTEYTINPDVGTERDIRALRTTLNGLGIKLILDFVPNHSAIDSPMCTQHPSYFIRRPEGFPADSSRYQDNGIAYGRDRYSGAWIDTSQFNLWDKDAREARIRDMTTVASLADGMRVDMAMLLLNDVFESVWGDELKALGYRRPRTEFWPQAIAAVKKKYPGTFFIAELYWGLGPELVKEGFDYVYAKELTDALYTRDGSRVIDYFRRASADELSHGVHFIENHDEPPFLSKVDNDLGAAQAAATIVFTSPGPHFAFIGQDRGVQHKLDVHLRRRYNPDEDQRAISQYYSRLYRAVSRPIFEYGTAEFLQESTNHVILFHWTYPNAANGETSKVLTAVNYSGQPAWVQVRLTDADPDSFGNVVLHDLLTGDKFERRDSDLKAGELWIGLEAWGAQLFEYGTGHS